MSLNNRKLIGLDSESPEVDTHILFLERKVTEKNIKVIILWVKVSAFICVMIGLLCNVLMAALCVSLDSMWRRQKKKSATFS